MTKKRDPYNGQIRNVKNKKKRFKDTLRKIFKERNFTEIGVNSISNKTGISKILLYRYYGNLNNLIEQFLMENDYWSNVDAELSKSTEVQNREVKNVLSNMFEHFSKSAESSGLIAWGLIEHNKPIFNMLKKREQIGRTFFKITDEKFGENIDFRAICAILIGGLYYLSAYGFQHEVLFCGLDVEKDKQRILNALGFLIDSIYEEIQS